MKKYLKYGYIIVSILLVIPSIIYLIRNGTIIGFNLYFNFFLNDKTNKIISTTCYFLLMIVLAVLYIIMIKSKNIFENISDVIKYIIVINMVFILMTPWTSSDIFYYMGVGELDGEYKQNPYYVTIEQYYSENINDINDEIMKQAKENVWANTTVVYGPVSQVIFKIFTQISNKKIDICLLVFKLVNSVIHILNCYLIYVLSKKKIFSLIYGLNPLILIEFIGNAHNDIILVLFVLLAIYFILKKNNLKLSIFFLALATGMKYFSILLLPFLIMYYYRKNKKIKNRILLCIRYGIIFLFLIILEYAFYFKDFSILLGIITQTSKYSKSIYSAILLKNEELMILLRTIVMCLFLVYYIKTFIEMLIEDKIKWRNIIKEYNNILFLALLMLTTFQQWYLIWLFPTLIWEKRKKINNLVAITIITELANTIYMYKSECYIYDGIFIGIIIIFMFFKIVFDKIIINYKKGLTNETKQKV
mgnify:FL=1